MGILMKRLSLFLAILTINAGCLTFAKRIKGPDGSEQLLVGCHEVSDCYEKARKECGSDFTVTDKFYKGTYPIQIQVKCKASESEPANK